VVSAAARAMALTSTALASARPVRNSCMAAPIFGGLYGSYWVMVVTISPSMARAEKIELLVVRR
jgi:hypothetical protein